MITVILGGARSGKSAIAERLVTRLPAPVSYLATLRDDPADPETTARIAQHRARRPRHWRTVTVLDDLAGALRRTPGSVLVDSLGPWVAACPGFAVDTGDLCAALTGRTADTVLVSDEVGLGVHPETAAGRDFRDALGAVNQAVAAVADRVLLAVAGRVVRLDGPECL